MPPVATHSPVDQSANAALPAADKIKTPIWDSQLISKYDVQGPRYTSYPTALQFTEAYDESAYRRIAQRTMVDSIAPLSIYVHLPFCQNICYYCACNKVVTGDRSKAAEYLGYLQKEVELQSALVGKHRPVTQLHLGGGTPTFLDGAELTQLMHLLASHYQLTDSIHREYSIEIDPRTINDDTLALLKGLGFNRISLGVQDFDPKVQQAINRIQPFEMIKRLTESARLFQFGSISYDLIYGLPYQTPESLLVTLNQVVELLPDRIAFYNYAHLPERFKSQRAIDRLVLPTAQQKISMLGLVAEHLRAAGYVHIGMDHFVRPDDELAVAQQEGRLQRNFQGYSTCLAEDLVGLGVSSISSIADSFSQNEKELKHYYQQLDRGHLPIARGLNLTQDDKLRAYIISELICNLGLSTGQVERRFGIVFSKYFAEEKKVLLPLETDALVHWQGDKLLVTEAGRPMLRNICMVFDKYSGKGMAPGFSRIL